VAQTYRPWYLGASPSNSGAQSLYDGTLSAASGPSSTAMVPWQPITGACSRSTAQWTAGIVAISNCESDDSSAQMTGLTFTGDALTKPYTVSGPIMADLWISSTRPDTTLVATVDDVAPDGTAFRLTAGSLVASLRSLTTTHCGAKVEDCSVYAGDVPVVPWHPYTLASQQSLPSTPTEVRVEVFPSSFVIQPGHRLRFAITTGDLPHQGPNLSTLANSVGGVTTVYFGGSTPSRLWLGSDEGVTEAQSLGGGQNAVVPRSGIAAAAATSLPNTTATSVGTSGAPTALALVLFGGAATLLAARRRRRFRD
jgi:putative CocE/NonD family hydrolase